MIRMLKCSTIAIVAISLSACESAGTYDYSDSGKDVRMEADQGTQDDLGSSCEPLAMCPAASCGSIADGCGGQLDCGMCQCVGGQPQQEGCGTCDLGALSCDADVAKCDELPLPQLTPDQCAQRIYVSKQAQAGGDGTIQSPLQSIQAGIDAAKARGAKLVLVAGSDSFEESITLANGVSILGGFQPTTFKRDLSYRPVLAVPDLGSDIFAVTGRELNQPALISYLQVKTPDAAGPSASNYGFYLHTVTNLTLHEIDARVGRGGQGQDGEGGMKGADGERGKSYWQCFDEGIQSVRLPSEPQVDASLALGGPKGVNPSCEVANGGTGGESGWVDRGGGLVAALAGSQSSAGTAGGQAGSNLNIHLDAGKNGMGGLSYFERGDNGGGGKSTVVVDDGMLIQGQSTGANGSQGRHGQGGGGGGGSGVRNVGGSNSIGHGGGGGGAGGCGGDGGLGGHGGGNATGLLLFKSSVAIQRSNFLVALGGVGGAGGRGGDGGAGQPGGPGKLGTNCDQQDNPAKSGDGGHGGSGAPGGHGGGGAGGASFGAFCQESSLVSDTESKFSSAGRAPGGQSLGIPGEDGLSVDVQGCR